MSSHEDLIIKAKETIEAASDDKSLEACTRAVDNAHQYKKISPWEAEALATRILHRARQIEHNNNTEKK